MLLRYWKCAEGLLHPEHPICCLYKFHCGCGTQHSTRTHAEVSLSRSVASVCFVRWLKEELWSWSEHGDFCWDTRGQGVFPSIVISFYAGPSVLPFSLSNYSLKHGLNANTSGYNPRIKSLPNGIWPSCIWPMYQSDYQPFPLAISLASRPPSPRSHDHTWTGAKGLSLLPLKSTVVLDQGQRVKFSNVLKLLKSLGPIFSSDWHLGS